MAKKFNHLKAPPSETLSQFLRRKLASAEESAEAAALDGSWVAHARLLRESVNLRRELDQALEEEAAPTDAMTDEQLVSLIQRAIASVPEAHLEVIETALMFRRGAAPSSEPVQ